MIEKDTGCFYIGNKTNPDAIITYIENDIITIDHTYVSEDLRGQGIAETLLDKVVDYAKEKHKKILPVCSYAKKKLSSDKFADIVLNLDCKEEK